MLDNIQRGILIYEKSNNVLDNLVQELEVDSDKEGGGGTGSGSGFGGSRNRNR